MVCSGGKRELAGDLLAISDRIFLTVLNNPRSVTIRNGKATITDARVEAEYARLLAEFDRLLTLAAATDDATPAPTVARVVDAIGSSRPPPLPELAPAPEIPGL